MIKALKPAEKFLKVNLSIPFMDFASILQHQVYVEIV